MIIVNENGTFEFIRNDNEEGYWVCVAGNMPCMLNSSSSVIVPNAYAMVLTSEALASGISKESLFMNSKRKKRKPSTTIAKAKSKAKGVSFSLDDFGDFQ